MRTNWSTLRGVACALAALCATASASAQPKGPLPSAARPGAATPGTATPAPDAAPAPAEHTSAPPKADVAGLVDRIEALNGQIHAYALAKEVVKARDKQAERDVVRKALRVAAASSGSASAPAPAAPAPAALAPSPAAPASAPASDPVTQTDASSAAADATLNQVADQTCGAGKTGFQACFYVGVFVASGSLTGFSVGSLHGGKTGHTLVSTAIPAAGVRMPIDRDARFSVELGLMSMLLSKDLTATAQRNGCRVANNDFEKLLPCEGNVSISPVVGTYVGLTAGTKDLGLITLMPMVGGATTSLDGSIRPYYGIALGLVNLSKTFNISLNSSSSQ